MPTLYAEQLDQLLSRPVSVENIASYEDAISADLIKFIGQVGTDFSDLRGVPQLDESQFEDAAFEEFGLPPIGNLLDNIQSKIIKVRAAGRFITERAIKADVVISPPDQLIAPDVQGSGTEFTVAGIKDRTQTALYVLQNLGVDLDTIKLTEGIVTPEMVRRTSYYTLEVPSLDKVLHVCDEERNASYIFDSKVMSEVGLTTEALNELTKSEKNELINIYRNQGLGYRFVHTENWADKIEELLLLDKEEITQLAQQRYQAQNADKPEKAPPAPEGYLSINGLASDMGVGHKTIADIVEKHQMELDIYFFSPRTVRGIPPFLQDLIRNLPQFSTQKPPEGVVSVKSFAKSNNLARETLLEMIEGAGIETPSFKVSSRDAACLLPEDQQKLSEILATLPENPSEGIVSVSKFAQDHHVNAVTVTEIAGELGIMPGQYKFGTMIGQGITPDQQAKLSEHPKLNVPLAPEDVTSIIKLARRLQSSSGYIEELIEELGMELREYKFHTVNALGLDAEQQAVIEALYRERVPIIEGAVTYSQLSSEHHVSYPVIERILRGLGAEPIQAKSRTQIGIAVPPDKVEQVVKALEARQKAKDAKK